jgi:dTMP kinase
MKKGKFIVIEGTDGSGKKTQLDLLRENLKKCGQAFEVLDFPQYYSNFWGAMVGRFLNGEFGDLDDVSPYLVSPFYMLDQASRGDDIKNWKKEGKYILSNRYITSSMGHQTAKFPKEEQEEYLRWLLEAGYKWLKVAREDLVIVLYVPPEISAKLVNGKDAKGRKKYLKNKKDIAEKNLEHQEKAAEVYVNLCKRFKHWKLINCVDKKGKLKGKNEIQKKILKLLEELELYKGQYSFEVLE